MPRSIRTLRLKNFKAFAELQLDLGTLTVLTGTNSSGKSSILQAIALLEQSQRRQKRGLMLNGPLLELGSCADALYDRISEQSLDSQVLGVSVRGQRWLEFRGSAAPDADFIPIDGPPKAPERGLPWNRLLYVRADRLGPTLLQSKSHTQVVENRSFGPRGEFLAHFLKRFGEERVNKAVGIDEIPLTLESQLGAWMHELSPDTRVYTDEVEQAGAMLVQFSDGPLTGLSSGRLHRMTNVGFGLSYALPVVVACLTARQGDLVLLENPEAHLHPRAQAALARLCGLATKAGAQVVLETHSDHVLNAVRIQVGEGTLRSNDVKLHYISRRSSHYEPSVESLTIDAKGRIERWPDGFFDEYTSALLRLSDF